ncbi:MAG: oxidoreductase, partial [Acidimicrobiaceae bacterium]
MTTPNTPNTIRAFTVGKTDSGWLRRVVEMPIDQLGDGDLLVRVEYSGINFKDGLAGTESGRIARIDPLIG